MTDTTGMISPRRALYCCLASALLLQPSVYADGPVIAAEINPGKVSSEQNSADESRRERLWLPSRHRQLRPLLEAAALQALEQPECREVLYGQLNEYRTERTEPTFTILCLYDARTTFNLIYLASELDAGENAASADTGQPLREDMQRLRDLLQEPTTQANQPQTSSRATDNDNLHGPRSAVTTPPEIF